MLHYAKLAGLTCLSVLPGDLGREAETRRLRRLKLTRGPRSVARFEARCATLGPGSTAVDLGANLGVYTEKLATTGATVHAFEPEPWTFQRLKEKVGKYSNVKAINAAAGMKNETVLMRRNPGFEADPEHQSLGTSVIAWTPSLDIGSTFEARCIDFLQFLRDLDCPVDLLKVDIEGGEVPLLEALLDAPEGRLVRSAFVETHEVNMEELRVPIARLRARIKAPGGPDFDLDWP